MHYSFDATPDRTANINGEEFLFFSGYSYLGMQSVPAFKELLKEGIEKYGLLFPSSRITNTRLKLFEEAESLLASFTGMEDCVLVNSGYTAGRIATSTFANELINLSPSHPAIQRKNTKENSSVFAVDAVETLTANITDFDFINDQKVNTLIVDDSHGIGIIGNNGEGIITKLRNNSSTDLILTFSLSKAFHINAGAICCEKNHAGLYRQQYAYTAATPPSPAMLYAFIHAQHLYKQQLAILKNNMQYFQQLIKNLPVHFNAELPVFILPSSLNEAELYNQKIIISSFAYPNINGTKYNRIVLSALHTKEDMERLAVCLKNIL